MLSKITLEKFRQIKDKILTFYNETKGDKGTLVLENFPTFAPLTPQQLDNINNRRRTLRDLGVSKENYDNWWRSTNSNYLKELLSYDLSDIPYEEWAGIKLVSFENQILDLSHTRANIDFELVSYEGNCNFSGCNIRNIEYLGLKVKPGEFDQITQDSNQTVFLSSMFDEEFKTKYYQARLTIEDLINLSSEQLIELNQKQDVIMRFKKEFADTISALGIYKSIELYKQSEQDFDVVCEIVYLAKNESKKYLIEYEGEAGLEQELKKASVTEIKNICYSAVITTLLHGNLSPELIKNLPSRFVEENPKLLLSGNDISPELREKYYSRQLSIDDVIDHIDTFSEIPFENFIKRAQSDDIKKTIEIIGRDFLVTQIRKHPNFFKYLSSSSKYYYFTHHLNSNDKPEDNFIKAVKKIYISLKDDYKKVENGKTTYEIPEWLQSFNITFMDDINSPVDLNNYSNTTILLNEYQRKLVDYFGINNIRTFEMETSFFSHTFTRNNETMSLFNALARYISENYYSLDDIKNGTLEYAEFLDKLANVLDKMRASGRFHNSYYVNEIYYEWLEGDFREKHPQIFMAKEAPEELQRAFYENNITIAFLLKHPEYRNWLMDKNLANVIKDKINFTVVYNNYGAQAQNFLEALSKKHGNQELLDIILKYGTFLTKIKIVCGDDEISSLAALEICIRKAIFEKIKNGDIDYSSLKGVSEFYTEYPDIFIDFSQLKDISESELVKLKNEFYTRKLEYDDIKKYSELKDALQGKDLWFIFAKKSGNLTDGRIITSSGKHSDLELLMVFGPNLFLELCSKYGRYLEDIAEDLSKKFDIKDGKYVSLVESNNLVEKSYNFYEICREIESIIIEKCIRGDILYNKNDAPDFLTKEHPELFLADDAPDELKEAYYKNKITFKLLAAHRDWLNYMNENQLIDVLLRSERRNKESLEEYFKLFGKEIAIKLGISRTETVTKMITDNKVELMKQWWDKTGGTFIPDYIVMQNFSVSEADKFLLSGSKWSKLMKIKSFAATADGRDAMLKMSYVFGAFDNDQIGYKRLYELLTACPHKITANFAYVFERLTNQIDLYSQRYRFFPAKNSNNEQSSEFIDNDQEAYQKMMEYIKGNSFVDLIDTETLVSLMEALHQEFPNINFGGNIINSIYRKNDDNTYTLAFNQYSCPKTARVVRTMLEKFNSLPIITPSKAHRYMGGFNLTYNSKFKDFFLANLDEILNNDKYLTNISAIQQRFDEISLIYSNVHLTLDLAYSYIKDARYKNVNLGNEEVAKAAAINNYSQEYFETLQKIYNYAKQRIFSSIPRVNSTHGKYSYEILSLDDTLAMAIGKLTDCCQRLGEPAEMCMEHSMVDKNGRLFVIRDETGEIVAQSWVWRNKDVICFDNVEVPDRQMWKNGIPKGNEDDEIRNEFTDEVLDVYRKAADEFIKIDEQRYKQLLEIGKITEEQYKGSKIGKITIGLGYSNIRGSIKETLKQDTEITQPLPFKPPVELSRGLYTDDSSTQFILYEREDRIRNAAETLALYSDDYIIHDATSFSSKTLLFLNKLEIQTKKIYTNLMTVISDYNSENASSDDIFEEMTSNYNLNVATAKVVMNSNFAIIYDTSGEKIRIADILFNSTIDNGEQHMDIEAVAMMQINLALQQISSGKEIDTSLLDEQQKGIYERAMNITEEDFDKERGIGHGR